jgi:hypothetical protein
MRNGTWPVSRPESQVGWLRTTSRAISAPELPAPTTRTPPSRSWEGLRYSLECSWMMVGSTAGANTGRRGLCQLDIATTTLSASNRRSRDATTNRLPFLASLSTLTLGRTGRSNRAA